MAEYNIIYGPPGTGKTTRLLEIIDFELGTMGVPSDQIAFVTFTRKGANEGINRAAAKFDLPYEAFPYFRTLHSFAHSFNKRKVMTDRELKDFAYKTGLKLDDGEEDALYMEYIDLYRNNRTAAAPLQEQLNSEKILWVMKQYKKYKETFALVDFTDIIENYEGPAPVEVAIIDEAQDLTTLQWEMVHKAFAHCKRVYIAGDDDQAIFGWSGADVNTFLNLRGHTEILSKSYRLPDNLVKYAKRITDNISKRVEKEYTGNGSKGLVEEVNSLREILINRDEQYLLLARNQYLLNKYAEWLTRLDIPYVMNGVPVISDKDLHAVTEWERLRRVGSMTKQEEYMFSRIKRVDATLAKPWYEAFNWSVDKILYMRDRIANKQVLVMPKVNLSTIHQVKGGEADNVVLMTDLSKKAKVELDIMPDSEHRVFYVGATRAKKTLTIVKPMTKNCYHYL
jgi:superfamily I DNA/RNA helicase